MLDKITMDYITIFIDTIFQDYFRHIPTSTYFPIIRHSTYFDKIIHNLILFNNFRYFSTYFARNRHKSTEFVIFQAFSTQSDIQIDL